MQATAHFEPDFMTQLADAKQASLDALMGETPENWKLCCMGPRNVAFFDALHYVETNFPNCDRRRRKREWRKALKRAYAGELPKIMVTLTPEPLDLGNSKPRIPNYPDTKLGEPVRPYSDGFRATTVLREMFFERKDS